MHSKEHNTLSGEHDGRDVRGASETPTDAPAFLESVFDAVREPLVVLDGRLSVQSANRSFYRTFRVTPQETEGRLLYDLGNGQWDIPRLRTLLEEILPQRRSFEDFEVEHDFPDIGRKVMLLNARKLRQAGAELILLAMEDVTERRRAEAQEQTTEARSRSLLKNVQDHAFFTLDPEGRVNSWSAAAEYVLGYTEAEAIGQSFSFIFTPEDRQRGVPEAELRAAREQGRAEDERWHPRKGGERFWGKGIVSVLRDAEGRLTGFSKIVRDMTAWKDAEQALRESEALYRAIAQHFPNGAIYVFDRNLRFRVADGDALASLGYTRESLEGKTVWEAADQETCSTLAERYTRVLAGEALHFDTELKGRTFSSACVPIVNDLGDVVAGMVVSKDVSERKRTEAALELARSQAETRQRYLEAVLEALPLGVAVTDAQGGVALCNRGYTDMWGPPPITRSVEDYEQYRAWWVDSGRAVLPHEWASARAVREGEAVLGQILKIERFDGGYRYVHNSAVPIRDEKGKATGCAVAVQDITELRQAEEALQEANRRKDAFLATLAHELRNPLAPLRTSLDLLHALRGDGAACEEPLRIMDRQLGHLVHLVDDLLDISRISRGNIRLRKERIEVAEIIDAALEMSDSGLRRDDRRLTVNIASDPLSVEGDRVRLVQVVANLLNNAAKFTDTGGHIDLCVVPEGDRVEIRVQDDGRGILRDRLTDIFEIFSQAEPGRDGGLGIGLSLVRGLVALHGGTVRADSEGPGCGATFTVSLPLCRSVPAQPVSEEAAEMDLMPPCRVLVVDDNRDLAEGLRLLLTTLKAEVRVAHDGAEAVRICGNWQPTHVLMDLGMPGMDGYEAARRLCANHPNRTFRLVAISGWGGEEDVKQSLDAGFDQHVVKPVGVRELKTILSS